MTKEQAVYAATLELIGSDILDPSPAGRDFDLAHTLAQARRRALHSTGPHVDCPKCYWTAPCNGLTDGEHFADLWEHLIARHGIDVRQAEDVARPAWKVAAAEHAVAA